MIIFWILAAGLMVLALLFVALPLLSAPQTVPAPTQDRLNLEVFRQRLEELDADLAAGFLDRGQYEAARRDLEREVLADLGDRPDAPPGADPTPGAAPRSSPAPSPAQSQPGPREGRAPVLALILAVALPAAAVLAYLELGDGGIIPRLEAAAGTAAAGAGHADGPGAPGEDPMASLQTLVQGLAERLAKEPDNLDGWLMLGRTYYSLGQPAKALEALEQAYRLAPRRADVIVPYAEALAANAGNRLEGRPEALIRTALEIEPDNPNARWLVGMLAYQQGRYDDAAAGWEAILASLDPSGEEADQLRQMIAEAKRRGTAEAPAGAGQSQAAAGATGTTAPAPTPDPTAGPAASPASPPAGSGPSPAADPAVADAAPAEAPPDPGAPAAAIRVSVSLAPDLAAAAAPGDTLFVFARAASGPPMPLAVQRLKVADLPLTVTLDDSMAMMPALRLSAFPRVVVGARISKSGQATPAPGDLEGQTEPLTLAATPAVSVTIDRTRP